MSDLRLYNTLSRQKELFIPLVAGQVRMYSCGPTVYGYPHIGNLRKYVFDDIVRRALESEHFKVHQIINITDVGHLVADTDDGEDKIELAAAQAHRSASEMAEHFTTA